MEEGLICLLSDFLVFSQNALVTRIQKSSLSFADDSTTRWQRKDTEFRGLTHAFADSTCCEGSMKIFYRGGNVDPNSMDILISRPENQNPVLEDHKQLLALTENQKILGTDVLHFEKSHSKEMLV